MPVGEREIYLISADLELREELMGAGLPTFIDMDNLYSTPLAHISPDAEMSFECEIADPNLMRKLIGLVDIPTEHLIDRVSFTCEMPFRVQVRKHRKKRINKKWAKKYGYKTMVRPLELKDVYRNRYIGELDIAGWVAR